MKLAWHSVVLLPALLLPIVVTQGGWGVDHVGTIIMSFYYSETWMDVDVVLASSGTTR